MPVSFNRIFKSGWKNFWRNNGFAWATVFILIITICLVTCLFIFRKTTNSLIADLQERVDISVYFKNDSEESEIFAVKENLEKLPEVKGVEYISRADALEKFTVKYKDNPLIMESLAELGDNPLLAHLNIRAWQASQYEVVASYLENSSFKESISKVAYSQRKSAIDRLFYLTANINKGAIVLIVTFAVLAVILVFNTVRLAICSAKEEITTMRLVGASNSFIKGPFIIQGIIAGLIASLVALLIVVPACAFIGPRLENLSPSLNFFQYFKESFLTIILIQLATGIGLSVFSTLIAMRKYLKI